MENWKRALVAGAAGASVVMFLRRSNTAGLILGGVALTALASEYPDEFAEFRANLPYYIDRGTIYLDIVTRVGERLAEGSQGRRTDWLEALLNK
jgi:hypothetical protein